MTKIEEIEARLAVLRESIQACKTASTVDFVIIREEALERALKDVHRHAPSDLKLLIEAVKRITAERDKAVLDMSRSILRLADERDEAVNALQAEVEDRARDDEIDVYVDNKHARPSL